MYCKYCGKPQSSYSSHYCAKAGRTVSHESDDDFSSTLVTGITLGSIMSSDYGSSSSDYGSSSSDTSSSSSDFSGGGGDFSGGGSSGSF